jgi:transcriptional regulator with XRE-family HTH domain
MVEITPFPKTCQVPFCYFVVAQIVLMILIHLVSSLESVRILAPGDPGMPRVRKGIISPVDEKTIGKRLRELRESRGMTQTELAEKLNIKQVLVSAYERGVVRMHGALIAAFAKTLDASADEILGLDGHRRGNATDRRVVRLLQQIDGLSRRERDALLKTISNYVRGARAG